MGKFFAESAPEHRVLASVNQVSQRIDVFVSHKSDDESKAMAVARCVKELGLTAWVDAIDMEGATDNEQMVNRIQEAISRASSLIAVVTNVTNESWWVPFEIGLAYEKEKDLATYCEDAAKVHLPSFLWSWPLVKDHHDLHRWCESIMETKTMLQEAVMETYTDQDRKRAYRRRLFKIRDQLLG